jgi:hypothetical protein
MEGNVPQDYLQQGEVNYDELMNNAGWHVAPGDQFAFNPAPQPPPTYQQYTSSQPSFDQYQQPAYAAQYLNSPYTSQYQQHGVSPEVFGPSSYSVEPSLQNQPLYHGSASSFSFAPQETATISPQSLQFHAQPSQPTQPMHPGMPNPAFQQQANYSPMAQEQPPVFFNSAKSEPVQKATPVQYLNVPTTSSLDYAPKPAVKRSRDGDVLLKPLQQAKAEPVRIQPRVTNSELHAINSKPPGPRFEHAPFMVLSGAPIPVPSSIKG